MRIDNNYSESLTFRDDYVNFNGSDDSIGSSIASIDKLHRSKSSPSLSQDYHSKLNSSMSPSRGCHNSIHNTHPSRPPIDIFDPLLMQHLRNVQHVYRIPDHERESFLRGLLLRFVDPASSSSAHQLPQSYPYDVTVTRREHEGFGFVIISSVTRSGSVIGKYVVVKAGSGNEGIDSSQTIP